MFLKKVCALCGFWLAGWLDTVCSVAGFVGGMGVWLADWLVGYLVG